jgi:hypothetical protein
VQEVAQAIGNNQYFGFKSSMGVAASANYKNLAYVAKELLHAHGGPDYATVRQYQGWTRNPKFKAEVDAIIGAFALQAGQATDADNDVKNAVIDALQAAGGISTNTNYKVAKTAMIIGVDHTPTLVVYL